VRFNTKTNIIFTGVILVGYWLVLWLVPDSATPFSFENNLVGTVDRILLPGEFNSGSFDPEGILSTLPAIAMALLGMFTGKLVQLPNEAVSQKKKMTYIIVAAIILIIIGLLWNTVFPINKKLWTSSFVCVVSGYSLLSFALFYYILDVKGYTKYSFFFRVVGLNSITIYLAQHIIDFKFISNFLLGGIIIHSSENIGVVVSKTGYFVVCWLFLYFLYKKKIFIKV
jgi:predicted acyltransferase